jgi:hypothetical protein
MWLAAAVGKDVPDVLAVQWLGTCAVTQMKDLWLSSCMQAACQFCQPEASCPVLAVLAAVRVGQKACELVRITISNEETRSRYGTDRYRTSGATLHLTTHTMQRPNYGEPNQAAYCVLLTPNVWLRSRRDQYSNEPHGCCRGGNWVTTATAVAANAQAYIRLATSMMAAAQPHASSVSMRIYVCQRLFNHISVPSHTVHCRCSWGGRCS